MPRKEGYRHIGFQVTPQQYEAVEAAAAGERLAISEFMHRILASALHNYKLEMPRRGTHERKQKTAE